MITAAAICGVITVGAFAALIGDATEAAIVAGFFATLNTFLNILLVRRQSKALTKLEAVEANAEVAATVAEIIPMRKTDYPENHPRRRDADYTEE